METTTVAEFSKTRTMESDPQYFGSYLNMARHNIFNISNYIADYFNLSRLKDDDLIQNSFLCNPDIQKINWPYVFGRTKHLLSILKVFDTDTLPKDEVLSSSQAGKQFLLMNETLKLVFRELQQFRNDYSHYYSAEKGSDKKIIIDEQLVQFLNLNFKRAISYTRERFKDVFSEDDFKYAINLKLVKEDNKITVHGMVFLIAMFLEREEAFSFISRISGLKGTYSKSFLATREVLMAFCVKLPHDKFKSNDEKQATSLDLINELNRCPLDLWNNLNQSDKMKFIPDLEVDENGDHLAEEYEIYAETITKQIRYKNRFTEFALKYIDYAGVLPKYKMLIDVGKISLGSYTKIMNNEPYEREIQDEVIAFDKTVEYTKKDEVLKRVDAEKRTKGFTRFNPHYSSAANKIGLLYKSDFSQVMPAQDRKLGIRLNHPAARAFLSANELTKVILLDYLIPREPERIINRFIQKNKQILDLNFINQIKEQIGFNEFARRTSKKNEHAYTEGALNHLTFRKNQLQAILSKYNLTIAQIPSKIIDYWLNIKPVDEYRKAAERITRIRLETKTRYKEHLKARIANKPALKQGIMASYLARDIIHMIISKEKKKKITSFYYNKLQESLALYGNPGMKELFLSIVKDELKLKAADGHPFLFKLDFDKINLTGDFYENYLWEKAVREEPFTTKSGKTVMKNTSWITRTFYQEEWSEKARKKITTIQLPENQDLVPVNLRINVKSTLEEWLENKRDKPVDLPTDLFDEAILQNLSSLTESSITSTGKKLNWNELFKIWWNSNHQDDVQEFYYYDREYQIYDTKVCFTPGSADKYSTYYQDVFDRLFDQKTALRKIEKRRDPKLANVDRKQLERVFKKSIAGNEKELRIIREQDMVCALMLEKILNIPIKLSSVNSWLSGISKIEQTITVELRNTNSDNALAGKDTITKKIFTEAKGKDYTILHRFLHDKRLPELFEYFTEDEINLERLREEIKSYNKHKQEIQDAAFSLEKCLIELHYDEITDLFIDSEGNKKKSSIQHKPYLQWLLNKKLISVKEYDFLLMVRNCFFHNQFPQRETMELLIDKWCYKSFAATIAEVYTTIINQLIEHIIFK